MISADVLRDAAGFAGSDGSGANRIEQRSLTVIDVAHDGDDGRAFYEIAGFFLNLDILHGLFFVRDRRGGGAEFARDIGGQLGIESLVDGGEDAPVDQLLDDKVCLHVQLFGKLLNGDAFRNGDIAIDWRRRGGFAAHLRPKDFFLGFAAAALNRASPLRVVRGAASLIRWGRRRTGTEQRHSPTRRGVHGSRATGTHATGTGCETTGTTGATRSAIRHGRLTGTGRTGVQRTTGLRRLGRLRPHGHAGARRRRLAWHGRALLLLLSELGYQIGTRRHDGAGGGLSGERPGLTGTRGLSTLICSRLTGRRPLRRARLRRHRNAWPGDLLRRLRTGCAWRGGGLRRRRGWQRRPRAGQNLSGARCAGRNGARRRRHGTPGDGRRGWRRRGDGCCGCRDRGPRRSRRSWRSCGRRYGRRRDRLARRHDRRERHRRRTSASARRGHRRLDRAAPAQQRRTQRQGARLVLVFFMLRRRSGFRDLRIGGLRIRSFDLGSFSLRRLWLGNPTLSYLYLNHNRRLVPGRRGFVVVGIVIRLVRPFVVALGDGRPGTGSLTRPGGRGIAGVIHAQFFGHIVVDRAGVGHFFGNAEFRQLLYDLSRLDFQLPRQLIDSDLTHIQEFCLPACLRLVGRRGHFFRGRLAFGAFDRFHRFIHGTRGQFRCIFN